MILPEPTSFAYATDNSEGEYRASLNLGYMVRSLASVGIDSSWRGIQIVGLFSVDFTPTSAIDQMSLFIGLCAGTAAPGASCTHFIGMGTVNETVTLVSGSGWSYSYNERYTKIENGALTVGGGNTGTLYYRTAQGAGSRKIPFGTRIVRSSVNDTSWDISHIHPLGFTTPTIYQEQLQRYAVVGSGAPPIASMRWANTVGTATINESTYGTLDHIAVSGAGLRSGSATGGVNAPIHVSALAITRLS